MNLNKVLIAGMPRGFGKGEIPTMTPKSTPDAHDIRKRMIEDEMIEQAEKHSMKTAQAKVREFMRLAGQDCPQSPVTPNVKICALRMDLIKEEASELKKAFIDGDLTEIADAIGDLLYVVIGTAVACGIEIEPVFDEIHRSNMTKFIDGHRRADGKWVKGPSYTPANLAPIIKAQCHQLAIVAAEQTAFAGEVKKGQIG